MYTNRGFLKRERHVAWNTPQPKKMFMNSIDTRPHASVSPPPMKMGTSSSVPNIFSKSVKLPAIQPRLETFNQHHPQSKRDRPPAINTHKISSLFEIHQSKGYSTAYRQRQGMGFLITPNIAMTTHLLIPSEDHATRTTMHFLNDPGTNYHFQPRKFFFTHRDLNFTLVCIDNDERRYPLLLHKYFQLRPDDSIIYFYGTGVRSKEVLQVENEMFIYTSGEGLPPGMPIFNYNWELQGIHHTSTGAMHVNQATRVDAIFNFLLTVRHVLIHPEIDMMLEAEAYEVEQQGKLAKHPEGIYVYWFQWFTRNIYRYNTELEIWNRLDPENAAELEGHGNWFFLWNSRIVYTYSGNVVIVGGMYDTKGAVSNEVWLYRASDNTLHKLPHMMTKRQAPAVVSHYNHVYVMGGTGNPSLKSWERFSFETYEWLPIAPMNHGRSDHSASFLQNDNFIYTWGGLPIDTSGKSIERYHVATNRWEIILWTIPEPLSHFTLFPVTQKRLAIIGGRFSKRVFVLEINESQVDTHFNPRYLMSDNDVYFIHEVPGFGQEVQSIFPTRYDEARNIVYVVTGRHGVSHLKVIKYPFQHFVVTSNPISSRRWR